MPALLCLLGLLSVEVGTFHRVIFRRLLAVPGADPVFQLAAVLTTFHFPRYTQQVKLKIQGEFNMKHLFIILINLFVLVHFSGTPHASAWSQFLPAIAANGMKYQALSLLHGEWVFRIQEGQEDRFSFNLAADERIRGKGSFNFNPLWLQWHDN